MCLLVVLLREEVAQLQEEVHLLRQMKDMLSKDLEETQGGCSADVLSATELRVQLAQKEQELDRAKEALQGKSLARDQEALCVISNTNINVIMKYGTYDQWCCTRAKDKEPPFKAYCFSTLRMVFLLVHKLWIELKQL